MSNTLRPLFIDKQVAAPTSSASTAPGTASLRLADDLTAEGTESAQEEGNTSPQLTAFLRALRVLRG